MIEHPASVVLTARIVDWCDDRPDRQTWLVDCLLRHNGGDWGDLDPDDCAVNDHALRARVGRLLSRYELPDSLTDDTDTDEGGDGAVWIITDDLSDPDTATTILWPADY